MLSFLKYFHILIVIGYVFLTKITEAAVNSETRFLTLHNDNRDDSRLLLRTARSVDEENLSDMEVQEILDGHNAYRRGEGASNMEYMVWNAELARMATDYVQRCRWAHSSMETRGYNISYHHVGENLQYTSGRRNVSGALAMWFREKEFYHYDSRNCTQGKICGHYTQLVWAKSREVGCGITFCANFTKDNTIRHNIRYFGCNYVPRGNYHGNAPYKKGPACSECFSGQRWCKTGLCYRCPDTDPVCDVTSASSRPTSPSSSPSISTPSSSPSPSSAYISSSMASSALSTSPSGPLTSAKTSETTKSQATSTRASPTVTGFVDCSTRLCQHGATLTLKNKECICDCSGDYHGENCQFSRVEDQFGAVFSFQGDISKWGAAWQALLTSIPTSVNQYCQDYPNLCCGNEASIGSGSFINASQLLVGSGYPYPEPGGGDRFTVIVLARHNPHNTFCLYKTDSTKTDIYISRETLFNGIMYQGKQLSDVLASCCNLSMLTAGPGSKPVTDIPNGWLTWKSALVGVSGVGTVVAIALLLFRFRRTLNLNTEAFWKIKKQHGSCNRNEEMWEKVDNNTELNAQVVNRGTPKEDEEAAGDARSLKEKSNFRYRHGK